MHLSYLPTLGIYSAALPLHRRQRLTRQIAFYFWPVLNVAAFLVAIAFKILEQPERYALFMGIGENLLWFTLGFSGIRFFYARQGFKRAFPTLLKGQSISIDIQDEYILSVVPGTGEGKYLWSGILAFAQNESVALLYVAVNRFLCFPTDTLSPDQHAELNDLIARNMQRKQK
jgi:hypothetical protein